jgi:hypothetical protein
MQQISKRNYNLNYLIGVILTASLGSFVSGYEMGVFNTCQRNVAKTLNWGSQADTYIYNQCYLPNRNSIRLPSRRPSF